MTDFTEKAKMTKIKALDESEGRRQLNQKGAKTKPKVDVGVSEIVGSGMEEQIKEIVRRNTKQLPNIKDVEQKVLKSIIGQDKPIREIITAIYKSIEFKTLKSNILIIGKSGSGKTETVKQIAKRLGMVYTIEDATKYTKEGYYGLDVTDIIYNLLENAHNDIQKAQNGIIIIDEIDKKSGNMKNDVSGVDVLKSLLKIIVSTKCCN